MINFSKISNKGFIGKILRKILNTFPKPEVIIIFQGPLRGYKWVRTSGVSGYWLGTYELEQQKVFEKYIKKGDVVYDVGAHAGFYTLLASQLVGEFGTVIAFEPNEKNFSYLEKNIRINKRNNIKTVKSAVSDHDGKSFFKMGENTSSGSITKINTGIEVLSTTIDKFVQTQDRLPSFMKIDVEGAEALVLSGSLNTIKEHLPKIFIAIHNDGAYGECKKIFDGIDYKLISTGKKNEVVGEYMAIYNESL